MLHVVDASAEDERMEEMVAAVDSVLAEVGADELPVEIVLNKVDLVDPLKRRRLTNSFPGRLRCRPRRARGSTSCAPPLLRDSPNGSRPFGS